ncbi:general transcription factor II-I repeat domain-containing protein 2 [Nephila pilipes]|uniref:General transcription factor II-I repeat domain-containing protein 2 n=1 Tax=Nephila pilipes TaxID=299642 RepID=A0A8X6MGC7_NEPPI|nr:general transcription factor II-I repeat domain-containing protein 2 [Nephila pilipes]
MEFKLDSPNCLSKTGHTRMVHSDVIPSRRQVRNDALLVCLWAACTLPFFCHTAFAARDLCGALAANERAALWTSWMTMLFAAVRPVFHAHLEEDLAEGTVSFINAVCRVKE